MESILRKIEAVRKEKGVKQSVLASLLGITQSAYSQCVSKNADIKYGKLLAIANKLNISVIDIITYPDKYVSMDTIPRECEKCKQKDEIITQLSSYIKILENKTNTK